MIYLPFVKQEILFISLEKLFQHFLTSFYEALTSLDVSINL
jgi:hypothetical protein